MFGASTLGIEPHRAQIPFLLDQSHAVKCLVGGRRSGKSHALAVEILFHAVRAVRERRPYRQLIVAPARDQAKLLLDKVGQLLASSPLGGLIERQIDSPFPELCLPHGGVVLVRAAHEHGKLLRGHAADRAIVDEAAYVPREVTEESLAPVLADTNGTLILASTPTSRGTWFESMFERGRRGDSRVSSYVMRSVENPHISREFVEGQREHLTERQFSQEYEGTFAEAAERVFPWDHVIACACGQEEEPRRDGRYTLGWDPAARKDKSAVVVIDTTSRPLHVVRVLDLRGVDYVLQARHVAALARDYNNAKMVIDGTSHGIPLSDLLRHERAWVEAIDFTVQTKTSLVMNLALLVWSDT